jgi:hypothetical protein
MIKNNKSPTIPRINRDSFRIPQNRKATRTEYKTMKGKKAAKEMAQTQHRCSTCQRQKSKYCGKCYGFNNYKPNFTTMESYQWLLRPKQVNIHLQKQTTSFINFASFAGSAFFNALDVVGCFAKRLMSTSRKLFSLLWLIFLKILAAWVHLHNVQLRWVMTVGNSQEQS